MIKTHTHTQAILEQINKNNGRFTDLMCDIFQMSTRTLAKELKNLQESGSIIKEGRGYSITKKGKDYLSLLKKIQKLSKTEEKDNRYDAENRFADEDDILERDDR